MKAGNAAALVIGGALWKWDGGPSPNAAAGTKGWVQRMYAAGCKGSFDILSLHLYDSPTAAGSWNIWNSAFVGADCVRATMDSYGDSHIPIISTESGGPTPKYTEAQQAQIVTDALTDKRIAMCCVYDFQGGVPGFQIKGKQAEAAYRAVG